jgi:NAD(P)-dependent dehydrogenase (short-subunit alcohol dehydrogenase family)
MSISEAKDKLLLRDRVAVVTGGARGIGRAIVSRFLQEGARVVFSDILEPSPEAFAGSSGLVRFERADACSPEDTERLISETVHHFGGLDILVNNAGAGGIGGSIVDIPVDGFDRTIALLLRGTFLGMKYAVPYLRNGTGSVINIASVAAIRGGYAPHAYTAAKAGVIGLTKSTSLELAERGIRVNAICPAGIPTAIFAGPQAPRDLLEQTPEIVKPLLGENVPLGRAGKPEEIANAAVWLASDESSYITGHELIVDGGLTVGVPWSQQHEIRERFVNAFKAAIEKAEQKDEKTH